MKAESKKRLFQILDDMNVHDTEHGTQFVTLHPDVVNMQGTKKGIQITMGVPDGRINLLEQMLGKSNKRIVLMVIDGDEYEKRNNTQHS